MFLSTNCSKNEAATDEVEGNNNDAEYDLSSGEPSNSSFDTPIVNNIDIDTDENNIDNDTNNTNNETNTTPELADQTDIADIEGQDLL